MTAKNIRRVIAAVSLVVLLGCSMMHLAGCSSILGLPEDGPVQTMTPEEQSTRRVFTSPDGPADDAQPEAIVKGFFDVMPAGVQSDGFATGKQFLTDGAASRWNADNRTTVYADVPKFVRKASTVESGQGGQKTVVSVSLQIQGELDAHGVYTAVASGGAKTYDFSLSKVRGQWRISKLPTGVMISSYDFEQVYRQVSLYQLGFRKRTDPRCSLALLEGLADARRAGTACRKCGMAGRRGKRHQYQADRVAARRCADARFGDGNESLIGDGTNDGCRTWHFGQADSPIVGGRQRRDGNQGDVWKP